MLKYFKKGSILLNYARGEVVDLEALAKGLQDGALSGAAIDVYPWEPEKNGDKFTTPLQGLAQRHSYPAYRRLDGRGPGQYR